MFSNYYSTLDKQQVARVHEAALEVLQTTGIRVSHPLALEKLAAAGARVDSARERVYLPPQMVEDSKVLKLIQTPWPPKPSTGWAMGAIFWRIATP